MFKWLRTQVPTARNLAWLPGACSLEGYRFPVVCLPGGGRVVYHEEGSRRTTTFVVPLKFGVGTALVLLPPEIQCDPPHLADAIRKARLDEALWRFHSFDGLEIEACALFLRADAWLVDKPRLEPFLELGKFAASVVESARGADRTFDGVVEARGGRSEPPEPPARFAGRFERARVEIVPGMRVTLDGIPGAESARWNSPGHTSFAADVAGHLLLKVNHRGGSAAPSLASGAMRFGMEEFDRRFEVQSNREQDARSFLTRAACRILLDLQRQGDLMLDLSFTGLYMRLSREPASAEGFGRFLDGSLQIVERLAPLQRPAVQVFSVRTEAGRCPVCGEVVQSGRACRSCRAQMHAECWSYLGRCATYGCPGSAGGGS
jgi:hypothetical protein